VAALLVPWLAAAAGPEARAGERGDAAPGRFERIVLVTIDTLRADHLGLYGYPRPTSPFLDELAARGVVFERAYAPMPTTAPSHATLFTGLHPLQHGLRSNGLRLAPGVPTLAQRLRSAGFTTAGFTSTHAHWQPTRLDRGFTVLQPRPRELRQVYRQADATVDAALHWLRSCGDCQPLFLFVHLFDPHAPLRPPRRHLDVFQGESPEARSRLVEFLTGSQGLPLSFYRDDPGRMLFIVDRYDAEIRFADEQLRRLYAVVGSLPGATLWVVTADHGEGLGQHRFMGHGKAYQEGLHVPLLFHASDGSLAPRRVAELVSHVDMADTLLALAGQGPMERGEGRSLLPLLRGEKVEARPGVFAQRGAIANGPEVRRLPQEDAGDLSGEQYAWIETRWKYLHHERGADELYDLESDPHETRDLLADAADAASSPPPEAARLRETLLRRLAELASRRAATELAPELDAQTREELRALGYLP
jgi:arylsulfatase A-like enzyme